jgi:hypothetical protein
MKFDHLQTLYDNINYFGGQLGDFFYEFQFGPNI